MNSLSFSSLWSAPLAPLQQQHIFMSVKCDTHTHTRMSPVLHCSLSLSLSLVLSRPPSFLHFSSLSFLSSEPPWSTVNSVEFQSSQELTLLDEADWVDLSTWWTFGGPSARPPAHWRLQAWHRPVRLSEGTITWRLTGLWPQDAVEFKIQIETSNGCQCKNTSFKSFPS